ncbi:MAG: HEAT repeat domain-containing protein [Planctomycetota bacterium]|jgi:HEAT repeat protein|nr:HEAT repeat domain-containing protein [Planctomycetota bacterium]
MRTFALLVSLTATILLTPAAVSRAADDPVAMTIDLFSRDDADFRAIGLDRVRHGTTGEAATYRFAAEIAKQSPEGQIELVRALADRGDAAAIPAITTLLLQATDPAVRSAAVLALGTLGTQVEVAVLKRSLAGGDPEKAAARRALTIIRGDAATKELIDAAKFGDPALRPIFIDILADRRARVALPEFAALTVDADAAVRAASLRALEKLGGPEQVAGLIAGVLKAAAGNERRDAERALVTVCTKNQGHERAATIFLEAFKKAPESEQETLLPALGGVGGPGAMAIVDELIASPDAAKRKFGLSALSRWPDATVASRLLDLTAKTQDPAERALLLGALIRIAPLPSNNLNDGQKLDLVKKTMQLCQTNEDRARLIERVNAIRTVDAFRFVTGYLDSPALAEPACRSVVELAHHRQLRDANKDEFQKALDRVITTTKNAELVERANAYKEGKTWERKKS